MEMNKEEENDMLDLVLMEMDGIMQGVGFELPAESQQSDNNTEDQVEENVVVGSRERLEHLGAERESLNLQVSVLRDQIDAQNEKVKELEQDLQIKHDTLVNTEQQLHHELLNKSQLTAVMAELSNVKTQLAARDKENRELQEKFNQAQKQIEHLEGRLKGRDDDIADLKAMIETGSQSNLPLNSPGKSTPDSDVDKLKKAVDSLVVVNDEKDKKIYDMRSMLKKYRKMQDKIIQTQGRKALEGLYVDDASDTSSTNTEKSSISAGIDYTKDNFQTGDGQMLPFAGPALTSTPVHESPTLVNEATPVRVLPLNGTTSQKKSPSIARSSSCEDIVPVPHRTPLADDRPSYGTLPNSRNDHDRIQPLELGDLATNSKKSTRGLTNFGKGSFKPRNDKHCSSTPDLAHTEVELEIHEPNGASKNKDVNFKVTEQKAKKSKGIRRFFGRMKRSGSQELSGDDERLGDFKRGGARATAGARLAWSRDLKRNDGMDKPFQQRDGEQISYWLHDMGLSMYVSDCKRCIKNGGQLLKATTHELEKDLGIKNHFHRKKLQLALEAVGSSIKEKYGQLNYDWVTRWLDDIGLPQYKSNFLEARIDGRMLHYLTVDDLVSLKVMSSLHHLSIKRGIQALRRSSWNPSCLKRRPAQSDQLHNAPDEVMLWTNHRVMEWLRTIDLSEYAPNLRGSGVHGALMVLEARFNAENLASLLSIPTSKTLLRRHLFTHFVDLIGQDVQHKKREYEASSSYQPLIPSAKIKYSRKRAIFGHKRSKSEIDADDLVCPVESLTSKTKNGTSHTETAKKIGVYSKELNTLTDMLAKDVPSSNV